ncbi:MAG: hypothetical protein HOK61_04595 [Alphaproteobacteria bacterium]|nr:hypothetical protein [Alphaproteobacteria bacterium]
MAHDDAPRPGKQAAEQPKDSARAGTKAKQSSPWSIRGVTREARAKATKAAARRRLTLGEWVTNALTEIANEDLGSGSRRQEAASGPTSVPATAPTGEGVGEAMQVLAERLGANEERDQALISLARRIDAAESSDSALIQMSERLGGVEQRTQALAVLSNRLEASEKREIAMLSLMRGLAEQSQRSEDRLSSVTKGLGQLAIRLEESAATGGREFAAALVSSLNPLEGAVRELSKRLPEDGTPPAAVAPAPTGAPQIAAPVPTEPAGRPAPLRIDSNSVSPPEAPAKAAAPEKPKLAFSFDNLNQAAITNTQTGNGKNGKNGRPAVKPSAKSEAKANKGPGPEQEKKASVKAAKKNRKSDDWAADHLAQAGKDAETLERLHPLAHESTAETSTPAAAAKSVVTAPEPQSAVDTNSAEMASPAAPVVPAAALETTPEAAPATPTDTATPEPQPDHFEYVPAPGENAPTDPPATAPEDIRPANSAGLRGDKRLAKPRRKGMGLFGLGN